MNKYPMSFKVSALATSGMRTKWETNSEAFITPLVMAIPPEFDGPGDGFSPEDLYAMALQNCFLATFKVFAEKSRLAYGNIKIETELLVDRDEAGRPWMAKCRLNVSLDQCQQIENAQRILQKTSESCMILNSVKTVKEFEFHVHQ